MAAQNPKIHAIYRYPVKGLSPEPLERARLGVGATLPADRLYAIENGPSGFDPAAPRYQPKQRYLMLMRNERLARLRARLDEATHTLAIESEGREAARGDLRTTEGRAAIEEFFAAYCADECAGLPRCCTRRVSAFPTSRPRSCRSSTSRRSPRWRARSGRPSIRCAFAAMST